MIWRYRADSQTYVEWLRKQDCEIGGVHFVDPRSGWIDISRPWMVKIGDNVTIAAGVVF